MPFAEIHVNVRVIVRRRDADAFEFSRPMRISETARSFWKLG
jgi:hypothetical protein